jgi:hypothetical protein
VIFAKQIAGGAVTFAVKPLSRILPPLPTLSDIINTMMEGVMTDKMAKRATHNLIQYSTLGLPHHMRGYEFTKERASTVLCK